MMRRRTDAPRIKLGGRYLGGRYLDEVQIRLEPPAWSKPRGASFVIFPAEHHSAIVDGDVIGENDLGPFRVESLQTPESISDSSSSSYVSGERLAKKAPALEDGGVGVASVALSTRGCPAIGCVPVCRICSRVW
jgi:hypothetical protein